MQRLAVSSAFLTRAPRLALAHPLRARVKKVKAGWKAGKDAGGDGEEMDPQLHDMILRCLMPSSKAPVAMTPEEAARGAELVKTYTRNMWKRHIEETKDFNKKIELKWSAIAALPTQELQTEALTVTSATVPITHPLLVSTPPARAPDGSFGDFPMADIQLDEASVTAAAAAATAAASGAASGAKPAATAAATGKPSKAAPKSNDDSFVFLDDDIGSPRPSRGAKRA